MPRIYVNMPRQYFDISEDNSFPLRLESILAFLIYQMQDTRRKIGSKMYRKKLMINWELKKVLSYAMKRYYLIYVIFLA